MPSDSIKIHIGAKDTASAVIQGVQARAVALGVTLGNLASKAIVGVINGMRGWVNEALEAEKANVALDAALRGTGQYTPELSKQYRDLANAVQDETGASDESVKAHIAQLTTLGVVADKMAVATRAVAALAAMGRDGNMAMTAVARALNGDIAGFERFSPEVRNATTITEKFAAANKILTAGYAQQKANLETVGGAWEALRGRIGDAREDIIGAIFEGLKLGKTFNSMQASVGKFLKSESFERFTSALRTGAGYALDIAKAMTADGGAKAVAEGMGSVILAALKDGADYVGHAIKSALTGKGSGKPIFGEARVGIAKFFGTPEAEARRVVYEGTDRFGHKKTEEVIGGRLEKEIERFWAIVSANVDKVNQKDAEISDGMEEELAYLEEQRQAHELAMSLKEAALKAQKRIADAEKERAEHAENMLRIEGVIEDLTKQEEAAKAKVARNQQRLAALAEKNVAEYIADAVQKREAEKARARSEKSIRHKLDNLELKESRGVHLSRRDREMLQDARDQERLRKAATEQVIKGRREELEARKLKEASEADLKRQRSKNERNIQRIADSVDDSLEVQN